MKRRKFERKYKANRNDENRKQFLDLRKQASTLAKAKKKHHYNHKLEIAPDKQKCLFSIVAELSDKKPKHVLPTSQSNIQLANDFLHYFTDKITKIRSAFSHTTSDFHNCEVPFDQLNTFQPATLDEINTIIKEYGIKSSPTDPLPRKVLQFHVDILSKIWLQIVNLSLATGHMECLTSAILLPLIKSLDEATDPDVFKN